MRRDGSPKGSSRLGGPPVEGPGRPGGAWPNGGAGCGHVGMALPYALAPALCGKHGATMARAGGPETQPCATQPPRARQGLKRACAARMPAAGVTGERV